MSAQKVSPDTYRRMMKTVRYAPAGEVALPETDCEFLALLDRGYDEAPACARIGDVS